MKRAIVIGALSFVGYHLVQRLLVEEMEVIALDIEQISSLSRLNEEKLLLIGRNANFSYHSLQDKEAWRWETSIPDVIYFCLCEPNQSTAFSQQALVQRSLNTTISFCLEHGSKLVLISSIHAAKGQEEDESNRVNGVWFSNLEKKVRIIPSCAILRVPVLYGPWHPPFMVYEQLLRDYETDRDRIQSCGDVVYVGDVAECLYRLAYKQVTGVYYMQGEEAEQHERGNEQAAMRYPYEPSQSLEEGLHQLLQHTKHYEELYKEVK